MILRNIIDKVINRLAYSKQFNDALSYDLISKKIDDAKINKCLKQITIGNNSKLYIQAEVNNMQNDVSKIRIGNNTHIRGFLQVFGQGGEITCGDFCYIGQNSMIWSAASISIGDRVLIAHGVNIHDNISHPIDHRKRHDDFKRIIGLSQTDVNEFDLKPKPIIIKNDAWIGFNSIILKGITIGEGAIVGAGSVVTKDVPDWTVVFGNPATIIREISKDER